MPSEPTQEEPPLPDGMQQLDIADVIEGFRLQAGKFAEDAAMSYAANKALNRRLEEQQGQIDELRRTVDEIAAAQPKEKK